MFPLTDVNYREVDSAEQDQAAHGCRLILLYALCKISPLSRLEGKRSEER